MTVSLELGPDRLQADPVVDRLLTSMQRIAALTQKDDQAGPGRITRDRLRAGNDAQTTRANSRSALRLQHPRSHAMGTFRSAS